MKVAVPWLQHSQWFGHLALSHTVCSRRSVSRLRVRPNVPLVGNGTFGRTRNLLTDLRLHTVCESAKCPNHWECWSQGTATFMIAGDRCTRACGFCAVTTARPYGLDADEPPRLAEAPRRRGLKHA